MNTLSEKVDKSISELKSDLNMAETKPQQLFTESQIEEFRHAFEFFDKVRDITFIFVYYFKHIILSIFQKLTCFNEKFLKIACVFYIIVIFW